MVKNFSDIYSVIPKNSFFKKYFLEIGPLINLTILYSLIILNANSKEFFINLFDLLDIFSKALFGLYFISIRLIVLLSSL